MRKNLIFASCVHIRLTRKENLTNMEKAIGLNRDTSASFAASHWPVLKVSPVICFTIQTLQQRTVNVHIARFTAPTKQDS